MDENFKEILRGKFDNIIDEKSNTVKIFLSSTFADTHAERDYLIANVYPKLRDYCKNKYGLAFQIYDMRWGISNEMTVSHSTTDVCLNEIRNCQKYSVGPNFIAFLSHRYGSRCLPARIKPKEFEILLNELKISSDLDKSFVNQDTDDRACLNFGNMLESCYELDENEIPSQYRLKNIDTIIHNYKESDPILSKLWFKLEKKLGSLLRILADKCLKKKLLTQDEHQRYFISVTEEEIYTGILNAKNVEDNVLYFQRDIEDLDKNIEFNTSLAKRFVELDQNIKIDESVKNLLDDLKNTKIPSKLPQSNIFKFSVKWDKETGISLKSHPVYIKNFGDIFFEQVKKLIDRNQQLQKMNNLNHRENELFQEVLDHARFCNLTASKFHGRTDVLESVKNYILDESNRKPYVIYGQSGCGKTAIIAKVTNEVFKIAPDPENFTVILRFLGTTPISTDIMRTIDLLIFQLSLLFNIPKREIKTKTQLDVQYYLSDVFEFISKNHPDKKVVIFLDSIDQLNSIYYTLEWFILKLPKNIKLIYSTLPSHGGILNNLQIKFKNDEKQFLEIKTLDNELAEVIIKDWLRKIDRNLSEVQLEVLRDLFKKAILYPLYIKLIFDIVSKWASFYEPGQEFEDCLNTDKCIVYIFKHLEKIHGKMLFSRTVIYMTTFKNGISENEIEDILSLDDDVLYDIFEYHAPPVRKLPIVLWARIKNNLKEYMVQKEIDDTRVIYWYHRRFIEVSYSFYISKLNSNDRSLIFSNVIDFFNETWKNKPKPYKYNQYLTKKFGVKNGESEAIRDTSMQPTISLDSNGDIKFNKRKLSELLPFITQLTANLATTLACEHIYFNYYFLKGIFKCISATETFSELQKLSSSSSYQMSEEARNSLKELKLINLTLLQCGFAIVDKPESFMIHILSRTINFYNYFPHFTRLVKDYDRESPNHYPLILAHQYLEPPMGELIFQIDNHDLPITHSKIGGDNDNFMFTLSNKINVFNMSKLAEAGDIKLPKIDSQFLNYIVFFENFGFSDELQLNDFPGGLTLFYTNHIVLLNFDSTIKSQKEFEKTISSVYQLSKDYVIVIFKNENFFEIYNLDNFNLVEVVKFQSKILLSATSVNQTKIIDLSNLKCVYLMISFDTNETEIFNICIKDDRIELNKELNVPSCGLKINSLKIIPENKSMSMISYENLSFTLCQMENKQISYINWKENKHISLKMLDASSSSILLLGSNGILYIVTFESFKCFEINGKFTNGCFMSEDKIIAVEGGALSIFKFKIGLDKHIYVKMGTIDAHYENITFFFVKDEMVLTTSKDGTVKIFVSVQLEEKSEQRFNFHKAVDEIKELININEENLISTIKNSNQLHIWNKPSGKIVYNLLLNTDEIILNVFYAGSKLVVASQIDKDKLLLRLYSIKNQKSKFELEENSRKEIRIGEKIKFLSDIHKKELFILFQQKNAILVHNLTEKTFNNPSKLEQNSTIDLSSISLNDGQFKIKNSCLVQQSQLIAIFHHPTLYLISPKNGSTIASKQISDLKTNSDKNFNHNLISIENTDAFIMLDSIGNLVYVNFNFKSNDIEYFPSNNYKFESFKINKRFLLAYTKIESKLLCFDLDSVLNEKSFKTSYFTLDINSDKLLHYGLSLENNYLFLVKNRKDLCFYRINGNNSDKIGKDSELMLHAEATSILCTNDFISISTMDRKVVSYLICDKDNLQVTLDKIQKLPRKSELDDETKRKNDLITNQYLDLNESGDEEIDYFKDEALEEENSKIRKKIKDARKNVSNQVLFQHKIEQAQLKNNWALNLVNKESEANVKETFSKPKVVISNNHSSQACLIS